jgi:hypothetical protein
MLIPGQYSSSFIREIIRELERMKINFSRKYYWHYTTIKYIAKLLKIKAPKYFSIFDEYWDFLIILDMCRYDFFEKEIKKRSLEGYLDFRYSLGSDTGEFLKKNFYKYPKRNDVIYIAANPLVNLIIKGRVFKVVPLWQHSWDFDLNTVHPRDVYEHALKIARLYTDKRLIIHFVQPHYPFINWNSKKKMHKTYKETGFLYNALHVITRGRTVPMDITPWDLYFKGYITLKDIVEGYKSNLEFVLNYVETLVNKLDGKIVITSDHGEAFGEKLHKRVPLSVYGHIPGVHIEPLIKIPWFVIDKGIRKRKGRLGEAISKLRKRRR